MKIQLIFRKITEFIMFVFILHVLIFVTIVICASIDSYITGPKEINTQEYRTLNGIIQEYPSINFDKFIKDGEITYNEYDQIFRMYFSNDFTRSKNMVIK